MKRRQQQRQQSFQPPSQELAAGRQGGGERQGVGLEVGEVKRKVKEAMKRKKKKSGTL